MFSPKMFCPLPRDAVDRRAEQALLIRRRQRPADDGFRARWERQRRHARPLGVCLDGRGLVGAGDVGLRRDARPEECVGVELCVVCTHEDTGVAARVSVPLAVALRASAIEDVGGGRDPHARQPLQ